MSFPRGSVILAAVMLANAPAMAATIPRGDLDQIDRLRAAASRADSAGAGASSRDGGQRALVSGLHLYRLLLSSQDATRCRFQPSCSVFAEEAVVDAGALRGMMIASDRLQRCHPWAAGHYAVASDGRLLDPVESYLPPAPAPPGGSDFAHGTGHPIPAAIASAVIPGVGKVWVHRPLDGLASALAVGLPLTFSIQNFSRDGVGSVRGWFHGSLAAGFYVGNIWGAAFAAKIRGVTPPAVPRDRRAPAERFFDDFVASHDSMAAASSPPIAAEIRYRSALAVFAARRYATAEARFLDVADERPGTDLGTRARFFQALSHAQGYQWRAATHAMEMVPAGIDDPVDSLRIRSSIRLMDSVVRAPRLSASRARVLSAVLPGAGQLYSRDPGGAIRALAVNALFGYYVYSAANTRSYAELVLAAVPLAWRYYRGNITAAGRSAAASNSSRDQRAVAELRATLGLGPDVPPRQ